MKIPPPPPPLLAVFAAMDGSGGAGVLADCRAAAAAQCLPLVVTTAITAQNLDGVAACWHLPAARVRAQFDALPADHLAAAKLGVAGSAAAIAVVAACLRGRRLPVVWDPVLAPTAGAAFADDAALAAMRRHLLPLASVITPNRRELLQLGAAKTPADAIAKLLGGGAQHILVTDIDGRGKRVRHVLLSAAARKMAAPLWEMVDERRDAVYHGSGCLFSSTLAARLAQGDDIPAAATAAHQAVKTAMRNSLSLPALGRQRLLR